MTIEDRLQLVRLRQDEINVVVCDDCKSDIVIDRLRRKRVGKYRDQVVKQVYFECAECKKEYNVSYDSKRVRALQAKMRRLQRMIRYRDSKGRHDEISELYDEYKLIQSELSSEMSLLDGKFSVG